MNLKADRIIIMVVAFLLLSPIAKADITTERCFNETHLETIVSESGENSTIFMTHCDYGCDDSAWSKFGYPGCKESDLLEYIIIVIGIICFAYFLNKYGDSQ